MPPGQHGDLQVLRLSRKIPGEFPIRLILAVDANAYLAPLGRPELGPGKVADNLEQTLGELLTVLRRDGLAPSFADAGALTPYYRAAPRGEVGTWRVGNVTKSIGMLRSSPSSCS